MALQQRLDHTRTRQAGERKAKADGTRRKTERLGGDKEEE
jgi:hypothetical protein